MMDETTTQEPTLTERMHEAFRNTEKETNEWAEGQRRDTQWVYVWKLVEKLQEQLIHFGKVKTFGKRREREIIVQNEGHRLRVFNGMQHEGAPRVGFVSRTTAKPFVDLSYYRGDKTGAPVIEAIYPDGERRVLARMQKRQLRLNEETLAKIHDYVFTFAEMASSGELAPGWENHRPEKRRRQGSALVPVPGKKE